MNAKRILACAALLLGLLSFNAPLSAAVESDVVGYTTITTTPGFNMQGVVFQGLQEETIVLDELLSGDFKTGDEVQRSTSDGGYVIYQFRDGEGWFCGRAPASTAPLSAGDSFWLKTPDRAVSVTFKGAVKAGDFRYESTAGMQMVSVDFPFEFALNDDTGRVSWTNLRSGDQIQVLTQDGGYMVYTYSQEGGEKWLEGRIPTEKRIPVGAALWLKTATAGAVLQVKNPIQAQ